MDAMRIDKWLWAARFFKTRTIAQEEVGLGRVHIDGQRMKASRDVRVGDRLTIRRGEESKMTRAQMKEMLRLASEPASYIRQGRPTKKDGRLLREWQHKMK